MELVSHHHILILNICTGHFYDPIYTSNLHVLHLMLSFGLFLVNTGKSTLLNLITDKLNPVNGSISRNGRLRIGVFTQHSADKFDLQLSAVENMLQLFPNAVDQEMRSFIGRFQIQGNEALKPMMMLSGGQKSRVAFAALAYQQPHVTLPP